MCNQVNQQINISEGNIHTFSPNHECILTHDQVMLLPKHKQEVGQKEKGSCVVDRT